MPGFVQEPGRGGRALSFLETLRRETTGQLPFSDDSEPPPVLSVDVCSAVAWFPVSVPRTDGQTEALSRLRPKLGGHAGSLLTRPTH